MEYEYRINSHNSYFRIFFKPLEILKTSEIEFYASDRNGKVSDTVSATFYKKPNDFSIDIKSKYNPQYHAGGPDGLLDGILGSENWRKGDWQGYQGQDFEAVVDLKKSLEISSVDARFLQDSRAWIVMPTSVDYFVSDDNVDFRLVKTIKNTIDAKNPDVQIKDFAAEFPSAQARYVKIIAKNFGKLPEWHQGSGGEAFIFIDEITIK
uniref:discoidin domain-containing protein n=1 Tax=Flavobacterium silvaticum TaxID=1852020 RepID=UPI001F340454|nr:discoidin domain-containing protein [Flavobacterium silvaticum]